MVASVLLLKSEGNGGIKPHGCKVKALVRNQQAEISGWRKPGVIESACLGYLFKVIVVIFEDMHRAVDAFL
jgi:hypothetical protein